MAAKPRALSGASHSVIIPLKHVLITGPPGIGKTTLIRKVCSQLQGTPGVTVKGFYTEEVREAGGGARGRGRGPRIGFDVVMLDGKRGPLARVDSAESAAPPTAKKSAYYVGKYRVDVASFEALALPTLDLRLLKQAPQTCTGKEMEGGVVSGGTSCDKKVLVIDEIGKMELFSRDFVERVRSLFDITSHASSPAGCGHEGVVLLATIPVQRSQQKSHWLLGEIRQNKGCKLYEVNEKNRDQLVQEITSFIL